MGECLLWDGQATSRVHSLSAIGRHNNQYHHTSWQFIGRSKEMRPFFMWVVEPEAPEDDGEATFTKVEDA